MRKTVVDEGVRFSEHSLIRMQDRGCEKKEVIEAIENGEWQKEKDSRLSCSKTFPFKSVWKDKFYKEKEVVPVFVLEDDVITVITVYVFFKGGK